MYSYLTDITDIIDIVDIIDKKITKISFPFREIVLVE